MRLQNALITGLALAALLTATVSHGAGTLRVSHALEYGGAENLNPYDPNRFTPAIYFLYSRLVRPNDQDAPSPDLALAWSSNAESDRWRFELRDNVRFHDAARPRA